MAHQVRTWRAALRVLALALTIAVIPLPGFAAETSQTSATPGLRASITRIAASTPLTPPHGQLQPAVRHSDDAGQAGREQLGSKSFFRTGPGIAVLAIVGAGTVYAFYSASHDRIHSVVRQSQ